MKQDNNTSDSELRDVDPGPPIAPLAELDQDVSPQFLVTLRKKIYRRTTANQVVGFSWNLPKLVLMELVMLIAHLLKSPRQEKI